MILGLSQFFFLQKKSDLPRATHTQTHKHTPTLQRQCDFIKCPETDCKSNKTSFVPTFGTHSSAQSRLNTRHRCMENIFSAIHHALTLHLLTLLIRNLITIFTMCMLNQFHSSKSSGNYGSFLV